MMLAIWYEQCGAAADVLQYGERPVPSCGPGEVLVEIRVSGVNPHDVKKREGWLSQSLPALRNIPHSDGAGEIVAVGAGVPQQRVGERVWVFHAGEAQVGGGAAAEFAVIKADHATRLPDAVSFEIGACLGVPFMTAHDAVLRDGPVTGQTILVHGGAGAVASYAIQLARWNGARVIATISSPQKGAHARRMGAYEVINYREQDVIAEVSRITSGSGIDRIVDVDFGANVAVDHAIIKPNGIIAAYSSTSQREPILPYYAFARKGVSLHFIQGMLLQHERARAGIRDVTALLEQKLLVHPIAEVFCLKDTASAHILMESSHAIGKILVRN